MLKKTFKTKSDYKFHESGRTACFVCEHVMDKKTPILFVSHEKDDYSWQFLCGENNHNEYNINVTSLKEVTDIDNSVNDLYDLPLGFGAERNKIDEPWERFRIVG